MLGASLALALAVPAAGLAEEEFRYDAANVDTAAHWAGRATLAKALMFSGLGEPIRISMSEMDTILGHAGYTLRPAMPDMAMVGALYGAGDPQLATSPDFGDPATLRWDPATFDRTLDPEVQAWSTAKIAAPEFHLKYHESRNERRLALMMLPQARAQGEALMNRLRTPDGLFAAKSPDGTFATTTPRQQAAVLWAAANLVLVATSERADYWHGAAREMLDVQAWRALGEAALAAVQAMPAKAPADRAIAVQAVGRYAITADAENQRRALELARGHADGLASPPPDAGLEDLGFGIYGLIESGRLFGDDAHRDAAAELFRARLLPLWDSEIEAFRSPDGDAAYSPRTLAGLAAGLNALRWYARDEAAQDADRLYPRLFETVLVRAGMLRSSPLPLVPQHYLKDEPVTHFSHPALDRTEEVGLAPVFAAEIRHVDGAWHVADGTFRSADAMLLTNMLVKQRENRADAFLPPERLAGLGR